jgi:hypothetical protein
MSKNFKIIIMFLTVIAALAAIAIFARKNLKEDFQDTAPREIFSDMKTTEIPEEKKYTAEEISYYINPSGSDENNGKTRETPFKTIQKAVDLAMPGDVIYLLDGNYEQDIISKRNGTKENPITITGSHAAAVKGGGGARAIEINHDHIVLENFTIDGLHGDPKKQSGYRDKLIYVQGKEKGSGVTGLKITRMNIRNGGGECIRLRYFAQENEISKNTIQNCGVHDFVFNAGGKNGEAIYIGTAPEQRTDGKNPTSDIDRSDRNWIHDNKIDTRGNECVDIKEDSSENIVENNSCTGQKDKESAGLDSRGSGNIFRNNEVFGNLGAGVRLGGDEKDDGIENDVYSNIIRDNRSGGIKIMREPQGKICSNDMARNGKGNFVGDYAENFSNKECD